MKGVMMFLVVALIFGSLGFSSAKVHQVGDAAGWTIGKVDYYQWANLRTFNHGDKLVFQYDNQFHNVIQVSRHDYHTCNSSKPLATHNSGKDTIYISKRKGHYFFICGVPGHCEAGQKVDVRIPPHYNVNANAASPSLNSPSPAISPAPPLPESSQGFVNRGLGVGVVLIAVVASLLFLS